MVHRIRKDKMPFGTPGDLVTLFVVTQILADVPGKEVKQSKCMEPYHTYVRPETGSLPSDEPGHVRLSRM